MFRAVIPAKSFESFKFLIYISSFFHLILFYSLFYQNNQEKDNIIQFFFYLFLFVAIFQSIYSYLQLSGLLSNSHLFFKIGGTTGNPNVLATFLSLVWVYGFNHLLFSSKSKSRELYLLFASLSFIFPVIILLQCRTAWLSLLTGCVAGLFFRFRLHNYFKRKITWIYLLGIVILLSFSFSKLYSFKQNSADGRLYIWKLTTEMILKKPLLGYSFNRFEKEYNLYQANYFASLPENEKNFNRSFYTETCCNDFLEITFETGITGLTLFILVFYSAAKCFFRNLKTEKHNGHSVAAFSSLITFCLISLVNYNTVLPFSMLFLAFLLAVISLPEKKVYNFRGYKILGIACCIGLFFLGLREYNACNAQLKLKKLLEEKTAKKEFPEESKDIRNKLYPSGFALFAYSSFLSRYGLEKESLYELEKAKTVSSNYNIYIALGKRYTQEKRFKEAIEHFETAINMMPLLILPRYQLLMLYHQTGNTEAAKRQAALILDIQPVKESEDILKVKEKAKQYLNEYP